VKALASQPLPQPAHGRGIRQYAGYARMTTFEEWVSLLNDQLPIEVYYEQVSVERWAREVTIIPGLGMELAEMWQYCEKVGYFGGEAGNTSRITEVGSLPCHLRNMLTTHTAPSCGGSCKDRGICQRGGLVNSV
jgi:hypothetical protein